MATILHYDLTILRYELTLPCGTTTPILPYNLTILPYVPIRFDNLNIPSTSEPEQKASSLPPALRRSTGRLALSLTLSSPASSSLSTSSSSSSYYSSDLLSLSLPSKRLLPPLPHRHDLSVKSGKAELDPAFRKQEEIQWTFSTGEKQVGVVVGLVGSLVLLAQAGWVGGLVSLRESLLEWFEISRFRGSAVLFGSVLPRGCGVWRWRRQGGGRELIRFGLI